MSERRQPEDAPIEALARFSHYIRFVSYDPARNRRRFYLFSWQPTLSDGRALVCMWGRLGTHGRSRVICSAEQATTEEAIARIIRRRLQRGYQVTEWC